jgi:hypothetical protein
MNSPVDPRANTRNRNRWMLIALFAMFFGAMFVAGVLRFSGWRPHGMKNKGELLQPYADLRTLTPRLADGSEYRWNPAARTWRIAAMPRDCTNAGAAQCEALLRQLDTVWQLAGKDADRVDLLWIGDLPADGPRPASLRQLKPDMPLRERLPGADAVTGTPVYVIDPNGFVVLRYAPGFDPAGLRTDLSRLLKLK